MNSVGNFPRIYSSNSSNKDSNVHHSSHSGDKQPPLNYFEKSDGGNHTERNLNYEENKSQSSLSSAEDLLRDFTQNPRRYIERKQEILKHIELSDFSAEEAKKILDNKSVTHESRIILAKEVLSTLHGLKRGVFSFKEPCSYLLLKEYFQVLAMGKHRQLNAVGSGKFFTKQKHYTIGFNSREIPNKLETLSHSLKGKSQPLQNSAFGYLSMARQLTTMHDKIKIHHLGQENEQIPIVTGVNNLPKVLEEELKIEEIVLTNPYENLDIVPEPTVKQQPIFNQNEISQSVSYQEEPDIKTTPIYHQPSIEKMLKNKIKNSYQCFTKSNNVYQVLFKGSPQYRDEFYGELKDGLPTGECVYIFKNENGAVIAEASFSILDNYGIPAFPIVFSNQSFEGIVDAIPEQIPADIATFSSLCQQLTAFLCGEDYPNMRSAEKFISY